MTSSPGPMYCWSFYWDNPHEFETEEDLEQFAQNNERAGVSQPLSVQRTSWGKFAYYPGGRAVAFWGLKEKSTEGDRENE